MNNRSVENGGHPPEIAGAKTISIPGSDARRKLLEGIVVTVPGDDGNEDGNVTAFIGAKNGVETEPLSTVEELREELVRTQAALSERDIEFSSLTESGAVVAERKKLDEAANERLEQRLQIQFARSRTKRVLMQKETDEEINRELEAARERRELDITTNIGNISSAVNDELRTTRILNQRDVSLGLGGLAGEPVVEYARGIDAARLNRPERLLLAASSNHSENDTNIDNEQRTLIQEVVDTTTGDTAGRAFLSAALEQGEDAISDDIANTVKEKLIELNGSRISKNYKKGLEAIDDATAWAVLKYAYVTQARKQSIEAHKTFIHSMVEVASSERTGETKLVHEMDKDFHDGATVLGFVEGEHYEDASPGALHSGYTLAPLLEQPGHDQPDAIDRIAALSGGDIASVGNNSFIALVNANTRPDKVSPDGEYSGAYLWLGYDPLIPAYDIKETDLEHPAATSKGELEIPLDSKNGLLVPEDDSGAESKPYIYWKTRVIRLTDKGYTIVKTLLDESRKNPDTPIVPFINPRVTMAAGYRFQNKVFEERAKVVAAAEHGLRSYVRDAEEAIRQLAEGGEPDSVKPLEMPSLKKFAQESALLRLAQGDSSTFGLENSNGHAGDKAADIIDTAE